MQESIRGFDYLCYTGEALGQTALVLGVNVTQTEGKCMIDKGQNTVWYTPTRNPNPSGMKHARCSKQAPKCRQTLLSLRFNCTRCGAFLPSPKNDFSPRRLLLLRSNDLSCNKHQHLLSSTRSQTLTHAHQYWEGISGTVGQFWLDRCLFSCHQYVSTRRSTASGCIKSSNHYINHLPVINVNK